MPQSLHPFFYASTQGMYSSTETLQKISAVTNNGVTNFEGDNMGTTSQQDKKIGEVLCEIFRVEISAVVESAIMRLDYSETIEKIRHIVGEIYDPREVFGLEKLMEWAQDGGFVLRDEADDELRTAVENAKDEKDEEIEELQREIAGLEAQLSERDDRVRGLEDELEDKRSTIEDLLAELR